MDYKILGANIRKHRKRLRLTQERLAELVNISSVFLCQIENANRRPGLETVVNLAEVFHVSVDTLLFERDQDDEYGELNLTMEQQYILKRALRKKSAREIAAMFEALSQMMEFGYGGPLRG